MENDQVGEVQPSQPDIPEPVFDTDRPYPDLYADSVQLGMGPFGLALSFALSDVSDQQRRHVIATVRMSPQLAFATVQLLRQALRQAQEQGLGINPPKAIMDQLKLDEEL